MRLQTLAVVSLSLLLAFSGACKKEPAGRGGAQTGESWPGFRGPGGLGVAPASANPPAKLDLSQDVRWKIDPQLEGNSSPIVWGETICLTGEKQEIAAYSTTDGKRLWTCSFPMPAAEVESFSETGLAAPTPCTDGQHIVAFFGTGLLACASADGKPLWSKRLVEKVESSYGLSASPLLYRNLVIQVVDMGEEAEGKSFVAAFDLQTGQEAWRVARPVGAGWASPALAQTADSAVLVVSGKPWTIGYDPTSGKELWRVEGLTGDVAASPTACEGVAFVCSDPNGGPMLVVRIQAAAGQNPGQVLWRTEEDLPDVASPVCSDGRLYVASGAGKLRCLQITDGKPVWEKDLETTVWASPILAGGRLYAANKDGKLFVLSPGSGEIVSSASLSESVVATPAVAGRSLYIRSSRHLWKLESPR